MRLLVCGGAGFAGSHFVDRLIYEGHKVIVYDDLSTGKIDYINSRAIFFRGDILDYKTLDFVSKHHNIDVIYNFAIKPLLHSLNNPIEGLRVNTEGTVNCCEIAIKQGIKYVHISSSEIFGTMIGNEGMDENHPRHPTTPYGASKCAGDFYVQSYNLCMGLKSIIIRPFNMYGPRMRTDSYCNVIYAFVKQLMKDKSLIIHGDGKQTRDMTYISDAIDGIYLASMDDGLIGHSINIGSAKQTTILEIAQLCNKYFKKVKITYKDSRFSNDVKVHECDYSRMRERYDWHPKIRLKDGLEKTIKWVVKNYEI